MAMNRKGGAIRQNIIIAPKVLSASSSVGLKTFKTLAVSEILYQ